MISLFIICQLFWYNLSLTVFTKQFYFHRSISFSLFGTHAHFHFPFFLSKIFFLSILSWQRFKTCHIQLPHQCTVCCLLSLLFTLIPFRSKSSKECFGSLRTYNVCEIVMPNFPTIFHLINDASLNICFYFIPNDLFFKNALHKTIVTKYFNSLSFFFVSLKKVFLKSFFL